MIYEYAIQPEVLIEWAKSRADYKHFERNFGLGTPRIISSFPTQQARRLRRYLMSMLPDNPDDLDVLDGMKGKRYDAIVESITECIVERKFENKGISLEDWEKLVQEENNNRPFGIIVSEKKLGLKHCLTPDEIYENERFEHPKQILVTRTNESIYNGLKGLLELARKQITIVDRYGYKLGAIKFFIYMLNELGKSISPKQFPQVHIIIDEDNACANSVRDDIVKGLNFELCDSKLVVSKMPYMHNRYVFTEHGGVTLGHGFSLIGDHTQPDDIILLEKNIYEQRLQEYLR